MAYWSIAMAHNRNNRPRNAVIDQSESSFRTQHGTVSEFKYPHYRTLKGKAAPINQCDLHINEIFLYI